MLRRERSKIGKHELNKRGLWVDLVSHNHLYVGQTVSSAVLADWSPQTSQPSR